MISIFIDSSSLLHFAVMSGVKEMVDLCVAVIPNINSADSLILSEYLMAFKVICINRTALHIACQQASLEIITILVLDKAKLNIQDKAGIAYYPLT